MYKIKEVKPSDNGYNVYFEDIDMVAFVDKKDEIKALEKAGYIKKTKKKLKTTKK